MGFAPLRDLQRFFRHQYADEAGCLLGVTLGFREPHDTRYAAEAPRLGVRLTRTRTLTLTLTLILTLTRILTLTLTLILTLALIVTLTLRPG